MKPLFVRLFLFSFFMILVSANSYASSKEGFPGRDKYPNQAYISMNDFYQGYLQHKYVIVDARSQFEYKVIKIAGAINIPLHSDHFFEDVNALANKTNKTLVFYCNGRRCMKSFKAAKKSKLKNVLVFDAGVFEWSQAHPKQAVLLGQRPLNPNDIISKKRLKRHFLPLNKFEKLIVGSVLIDVRDIKQRRGNGLFLLADKSAPLDSTKKLDRYINKAIKEDKVLLAYDNAGKQVRWLQYYLERKGLKKYYFMEGGAKYYHYYQPNVASSE